MLFNTLVLFSLVSCGGGGSGSSSSTNITPSVVNIGVVQKGPLSIGSNVVITELDAAGVSTGTVTQSKVSSKSGSFSYQTDSIDSKAYYRIQATGFFLDENTGSVSEDEVTLSTITNNPNNSSVNVLTHWLSKRTDALLADGKTLKASSDRSQEDLLKLFGIENSNTLDVTTSSDSLDEDNAMLLLLSGALMEASQRYTVNSQLIIDEIGDDFADDGQLSEKGDDWFIRLQNLIKKDPIANTKKYAKAINDQLGYNVTLDKKLPALIPLASRPVADVPPELLAEPSETITLDGSASNDGEDGGVINFTWFRVDQQIQYDVQVNDRFSATPTITMPDEEAVLAAPNQEISLLYALVVTDVDKLTHTAVVKVTVRIPPLSNNEPIANLQTLITDEDTPIAIALTASDADGDAINYILRTPLPTTNGLVELDPALGSSLPNIVYTPAEDYSGSDSFTFFVNDGFEDSNIATVDIQVNPINDPPLADAGLDQTVESLQTVTLDGSESSDVDGTVDAFLWEQTSGSLVSLSAISNPSFTAPDVSIVSETLTFNLVVTDNEGLDSIIVDTVDIVVTPLVNDMPVANAGPDQTITSIRTDLSAGFLESTPQITLDGSSSTDTEDATSSLTFDWVQISGPVTIEPNDLIGIMPVFNITGILNQDIDGDYVFRLVVTDSEGLSSISDEVTITVGPNQPPTATDVFVPIDLSFPSVPTSITLIGVDPDGNNVNLIYQILSLPSTGSLLDLSDQAVSVNQTFDDSNNIRYQSNSVSSPDPDSFTYRVIDELGAVSNDAVVNLTEPNTPPRANAGFSGSVSITETATPAGFLQTATINLDGTRSSDNEDASVDLNYQWTQISGPITIPVGDVPQVREPSFEITNTNVSQILSGVYEFELQVTDTGGLVSAIDEVSIGASLPNPLVIAIPGEDRDIIELTTVQVFGSGTSPMGVDNSLRVTEWRQIDIIPGTDITLVFEPSFQTFSPTFVAPAVTVPTVIKLQLIVFDNEFGFSEPAVVTFTIFPTGTVIANDPPTAIDQNISIRANGSSALFDLRGLGDDPDGDNLGLTYEIIGFNDPGQGLNDPNQGSIRSQIIDFVYTPLYTPTNPVVENSLTYVAIDQDGAESDSATITFTPIVSPPGNTAPVAQDITLNIGPPLNSSNSRQLLSYSSMIQDAENDDFVINQISINDTDVRFQLLSGNLRMDNRNSSTASTGIFEYQAVDIYGNISNTVTITINYIE